MDNYSVINCRCDVFAFDLRRSMCRPSKIDVSTFEDRCVDLRRSMWNYVATLAQNIDTLVVCELCRRFALQFLHLFIS